MLSFVLKMKTSGLSTVSFLLAKKVSTFYRPWVAYVIEEVLVSFIWFNVEKHYIKS